MRIMKSVQLPILILVTLTLYSSRIENVSASEGESPKKENREEEETPDDALEGVELQVKPSLDICSYRGMTLANNLKVLLIHDPTATKKFVSFSVGVGTFNDPKELPGLTNLLGSMLLLGSEDYPADLTGDTKLPRMSTNPETQTFTFEIERIGDFYYYELEVFATSMRDPLLAEASQSALEDKIAELRSNAESLRQLDKDPWAIHQIERMLGNDNHPHSYFSQANQDILRGYPGPIYDRSLLDDEILESIGDKLKEFFKKWYSADMMTLVVMGDDKLDVIEKEIRTIFGAIGDKKVRQLEEFAMEDYVKNVGQVQRKIYVVPEKDIHCLRLFFSTPDLLKQYKKAPVRYVSHLIEYGGPGSLVSALRKRELCEDLKTVYEAASNLGIFNITCFLTEKGVKVVDSIVELIFQYINMIKNIGVEKYIFDELEKIDRAEFMYKRSTESPSLYVEELAIALHKYPLEDLLSFKYLHPEWDEELIKKFLSYLKPENMNITIVSKSLKEEATETEKFFQTNYKITNIDEHDILVWSKAEYSDEFRPPPANEFVPEDFTLIPIPDEVDSLEPKLIQDSFVSQIWFMPDRSLQTPKMHVYLQFFSPMTRLDPSFRCHLEIFMKILKSSLNEELHAARVAGLDWSLTSTHYGIIADVYGYDDKLPLLLERIIKKFTDYEKELELNETLFLEAKKEFQDDLTIRGSKTRPALDHGWDYLTFLLSESGWTDEDLLIILEPLVYEEMLDFLPDLMANLFIQGLIHGNCSNKKADKIIEILETPFESIYGLLPQQILPERTVKLNEKTHIAFLAANTNPGVHAYYAYYQLNSKTIRDTVLPSLLVQVLEESCRKILGDNVLPSCGDLTLSGIQGLFLMSASKEKSSHELDKITEDFIKKIPEMLSNMSEEEFTSVKETLIAKKSEKPRHLKLLTQKYWYEIMNRTLNFDRSADEIQEVKTLKISDLLSFYKKYLDPSSSTRSKLAVHILPQADPPLPLTVPSGVSKIENITIFKSSLKLLPLPRSKIPSSTPGNKSKLRKPLSTFEDSDDDKESETEPKPSSTQEASTSKVKDTIVRGEASTSGEKGESSSMVV